MVDTVHRVYDLLDERDMSLYQLSQLSGISYSTVKTTEKRGGQLTVETIERICFGLGITMSDFFKEDQTVEAVGKNKPTLQMPKDNSA